MENDLHAVICMHGRALTATAVSEDGQQPPLELLALHSTADTCNRPLRLRATIVNDNIEIVHSHLFSLSTSAAPSQVTILWFLPFLVDSIPV